MGDGELTERMFVNLMPSISNALGLICHRSQDDTQGLTSPREMDSLYSNAVYRACESTIEQIGVTSQRSLHILFHLPTFDHC